MLLASVCTSCCAPGGLHCRANVERAIKAFQNLQLTEHHIDSIQQSAAGASGDERRGGGERGGAGQLAGRSALLRHRPPDLPGPHHGADRVLVPVRAAQLPAPGRVRSAAVHVQRALLGRRCRYRRRHGRLLPGARRRPTTLLRQCGTYLVLIHLDHRCFTSVMVYHYISLEAMRQRFVSM